MHVRERDGTERGGGVEAIESHRGMGTEFDGEFVREV